MPTQKAGVPVEPEQLWKAFDNCTQAVGASCGPPGRTEKCALKYVNHHTTAHLPEITVPTLVLAAERDTLTPVGGMKFIHRQIPGSHFVVLPRCGHGCMWEIPEQFNDAILQFLAS
jgi:pimeloyl-ACP methyl ester carboxylesterase